MDKDGGIVPVKWFNERLSIARFCKSVNSIGMFPVNELFERSKDCKLVQFEMNGEMGPLRFRFWSDSLYTRLLLHVMPWRLEMRSEHGFVKVGLVQLWRLMVLVKDWCKWVKHDSSLGCCEDGGKMAHVSRKGRRKWEMRMLGCGGVC